MCSMLVLHGLIICCTQSCCNLFSVQYYMGIGDLVQEDVATLRVKLQVMLKPDTTLPSLFRNISNSQL